MNVKLNFPFLVNENDSKTDKALFLRIHALQPAERLNALCNANWYLPKTNRALERLLQNPREGDFWQADHIVAVAEGGGGCGLENLRTLCTPCHQNETEKLKYRLRLNKTSTSSADGKKCKKDMDLRKFFTTAPQAKEVQKAPRKRKYCAD